MSGPIGEVRQGPTIIINQHQSVPKDSDGPKEQLTEYNEINKEVRNKKQEHVSEDIRFYYQTNLVVLSPLPLVQLRPFNDDYFTELVIKQISSGGRSEIKARNEFSFREIFKDSSNN